MTELIWKKFEHILPNGTLQFKLGKDYYCTNDWDKVRKTHGIEQVLPLHTDQPVQMCFFAQMDPKLNPDKSVPETMGILQTCIESVIAGETPIQFEHSAAVKDENVYEVRIRDHYVRGKDLPAIWHQVLLAIKQDSRLRVIRRDDNCVIREDWFLLQHRETISVTTQEFLQTVVREIPKEWEKPIPVAQPEAFQGRAITQTQRLLELAEHTAGSRPVLSVTPLYERRENPLMPRVARITLKDAGLCSCSPDLSSSYIDVFGQQGYARQYCTACDQQASHTLDRADQGTFQFLRYFWGDCRWMKALNAQFTQLATGKIVEIMVDEYNSWSRTTRTKQSMIEYYSGNKFVSWVTDKKGNGSWELHDVIAKLWLSSLDRARCKDIAFNPQRKPGRSGDFFNVYEGLAFEPVAPAPGEEASPLVRKHILEVICAGSEQQSEFLLNCLAKMIKYPWMKLKICIVFVSKQGAGKNTLLDLIREFYGRHGVEITHQRHVTGNFNDHLRYKLFLVLNEATWGGDKAASGAFKAAITECDSLFEPKGVDAKEGTNHWSFFVASNEKWCIPATLASRRFAVFDVSDERIGDFAYFNAIHQAMDREKREFLWFLLNRPISSDWDPAQHMPPRTVAMAGQILQDRSNGRLKWLVDQLEEEGEWYIRNTLPIIRKGQSTWVTGTSVRDAWIEAAQHDRHLKELLGGSQKSLTQFFQDTLGPECFNHRAQLPAEHKIGHPQANKSWFYQFAPAEDIMKHLAENCLKVPDYFVQEPDAKKQKSTE